MIPRALVLVTLILSPLVARAQSAPTAPAACLGRTVSPDGAVDALADCLNDPNPEVRDGIAFDALSKRMRAGALDVSTLRHLQSRLLATVARGGSALQTSFPALTLAEIARTDRVKPWMTDAERDALVEAAARFLTAVTDYRAFTQAEGYFHSVAHGADFALQLALNPAVLKPQLERLLSGIAAQVAPGDPTVVYWAGEPDRLARAVIFIAQRNLLSDDEWRSWFAVVMDPRPLAAWDTAFRSEVGIRKRHNARAFLLSVFATATTTEDAGIRRLLNPAREHLKSVP